jgi:hypothetical protein
MWDRYMSSILSSSYMIRFLVRVAASCNTAIKIVRDYHIIASIVSSFLAQETTRKVHAIVSTLYQTWG